MTDKIDANIKPQSYDEYFNLIRTIFLQKKFNTKLLHDPDFISFTMYRLNKYEPGYDPTKANRWTWYTNHVSWSYFSYIHKQNKERKKYKEYKLHIKYINKNSINYKPLYNAIALLDDFDKEILHKYYFQGYTYEDISQEYGCTRENIRINMKRIREKLKNQLEGNSFNESKRRNQITRITSRNQYQTNSNSK